MEIKKIITSVFVRLVVSCVSGLLFLVIAAQMVLWGGLLWLKSETGRGWMETSLSALAAETGYTVTLKKIDGLTFQGINVGSLDIADAQGPLLEARGISLNLGAISLLTKTLSLSAFADSLSLYRLPKSEQSAAPFSVPDIYFKALNLEKVRVGKLFMAKEVLGSDVTTAASLSANISQRDGALPLKLSLKTSGADTLLLPEVAEIKAVFSPQAGQLVVDSLELSSPTYALRGKGTVGLNDDAIDFDLQGESSSWPGIEGKISFDARLTGTTDKPAIEADGVLNLVAAATYIPGDINFKIVSDGTAAGRIEMRAAYKGSPLTFDTHFLYAGDILHFKAIKTAGPGAALSGALDYNTVLNLAEGKLDVAIDYNRYKDFFGGNLSGHGQMHVALSHKQGRQAVSLSLQNLSIGEAVVSKLKASLVPLTEAGLYGLSTEGSLRYDQPFSWAGSATVGGNDLKVAVARNIALSIKSATGTLSLTGSITQKEPDISVQLKGIPLNVLPAFAGYDALDKARISGSLSLRGELAKPLIKTDLTLSQDQAGKKLPVAIHIAGSYADKKVIVDINADGSGVKTLRGHAELPLRLSLSPFYTDDIMSAALSANVAMDADTKAVSSLFLPENTKLGGYMKGRATITGALANPQMTGDVSLQNGSFVQTDNGIVLKNIYMRGAIDNKDINIKTLTAQDRKDGKITAHGKIGIGRKNMPVDLSIRSDEVVLFHDNDLVSGSFSADVAVTGDRREYIIKGTATTRRLDITLPARFASDVPQLNIVRNKKTEAIADIRNVRLQMELVAKNQIFVRGWGLDTEFGGTLKVGGTLAAPLFTGAFDSRRGRYEEFGKIFDIEYAHLRFEGTVPPSPYLDVMAETSAQNITAQINLKGNIAKPEIILSSVPALPQDEVLSRLLFGKNLTNISPFQAVQLANSLQRLSGRGGRSGFEPLSTFRRATGLDDLQIGQNENGTTVGAGKYITEKVYLEAETGSGENSGAAKLRIDLSPQVKAESKVGQDNKTGGGIFWQRDY